MSRPLHIAYPGCWYQIMDRGTSRGRNLGSENFVIKEEDGFVNLLLTMGYGAEYLARDSEKIIEIVFSDYISRLIA